MEPDVLGAGFECQTLTVTPDAEGAVVVTLVRKRPAMPSHRAVLYVHGYVDYFFQHDLAAHIVARGMNFYAVDLRKYGRSLRPYQTPNFCTDIEAYFEDLDTVMDLIRTRDGNTHVTILAHSTGGLIAALYAHHRRHLVPIDALALNSPFFDLNVSWLTKRLVVPVVCWLGRRTPKLIVPQPSAPLYGRSLHYTHHGEWHYDVAWKPIEGIPLRLGWLNAIHRAQRELQRGLDITCPVLVLSSTRSLYPRHWTDQIHRADIVLDVDDINRCAVLLGNHVTRIRIPDGIHDLFLSREPVRTQAYDALFTWMDAYTGVSTSRARTIMDAIPVTPAAERVRHSS